MMNDNLIGRQLANFRIDSVLGRGGMGQVYYGWDVKLLRPVAIKVIDNRFRGEQDYTRRFVTEARVVATWRHENVIQVYYAGEEEDLYYFVMEYIPGKNLGDLLTECARDGRLLPKDEVLRIGRSIARALDYAHKQGVIHRDVKPQNVLIAKDSRVVLTDFGLALHMDKGSRGEVFGTAHYIAPEQARRSADAVPQSDLYALGVMLYEMLTGTVPFDDPSPTSVALQHLTQEPPAPRLLNPTLSVETENVLLKALSKQPDQRYPTGRALLDALEKALAESPSSPDVFPIIVLPPPPAESSSSSSPPFNPRLDDPMVGKKLDEFNIEALLGQGGMGRVYRAFDTRLNRPVAIKIIDPAYRSRPDYFIRFEREARAIESLEHLNIIQLFHYRETDGTLYMAMQYVEGVDLSALLEAHRQKKTWISPDDILHITSEICSALDHMHSKGVVHRDLKPSNIMMTKQGHIVITDFGLALLADVGTQGKVFGSARYMAPEQVVSSAKAIPQSDIYSMGVILYEMFTGVTPFTSQEPMEVAMQHMNDAPRPPSELRPEVTPEIEAVILKALAKEPKERFPDGASLVRALAKALRSMNLETSVSAPPARQEPSALKKLVASRWLRLAATVAVLLAAGWLFINSLAPGQTTQQPTLAPSVSSTQPLTQAGATLTTASQQPAGTSTSISETVIPALPEITASPTFTLPPKDIPTVASTPNIRTVRTEDRMPMMLIPSTTFMMGASTMDPDAEFDERPQHRVTIDAFYIDQREVSVSQYAAYLNTLKKHTGDACLASSCGQTKAEIPDNSHLLSIGQGKYQAEVGYENYPVNSITWYGAQGYCQWVDARLPTEAEWELAARGTDGRLYPWGNKAPDETLAVFNTDYAHLQPVDSLPAGASFYGVLHMAGNVMEWVADTFADNFYSLFTGPTLNPLGPPSRYRTPRVLRGGSWLSQPIELRSSARHGAEPLLPKVFGYDVGFRCVRPISTSK